MLRPNLVSVFDLGAAEYPEPPYSPHCRYPEYGHPDVAGQPNRVYDGIRELFRSQGMDAGNHGTAAWNPLGELIAPGTRVLIKPNLVRHYHPYGLDPRSLVTHASVVRAVCDYALKAAGPQGEVVIADAPLQSCGFAEVMKVAGLDAMLCYYAGLGARVRPMDLRLVRAVVDRSSLYGKVLVREQSPGDPLGYTHVNLGPLSLHHERPVAAERYRVTCYDPAMMSRHHGGGRHSYVIANTVLNSEVVINLPKMKTHHKAGITAAMKNFVGINGHKDCLPHHVQGAAERGGDEYPRASWMKSLDSWLQDVMESGGGLLARKGVALAHRILYAAHMRERGNSYWEGSWYGNDTISRTTVDLNRIVRYADRSGVLHAEPQRKIFSIVDGVIAGEEDGPLAPTPKPAGVLVAGSDVVAVDMVVARLMGFDYRRIPTLGHALDATREFPLADCRADQVQTVSNDPRWADLGLEEGSPSLGFTAHRGWRGQIEL